ncbi:TnsD family Tn7-like transposition protein [Burkholderia sp. 22PA0099]|uniref:TnsD family Tn7-like transposition protein n=1 Tax=Burkholderia sp. 22PA0099 TaxID=3237372 RepID=UPI0039C190E4
MSAHTFFAAADDESACSILKMVSQTTDIADARSTYVRFAQRGGPIAGSLPCRAARFCAITENAYGAPSDVLTNHSLARWNAIGMTAVEREEFMQSLVEGRSWTQCPRFDSLCQCGNRTELHCPDCAALDKINFGREVNHLAHCIGYVSRCRHHDAPLVSLESASRLEALLIKPDSGAAYKNSRSYMVAAAALAQRAPEHLEVWDEVTQLLKERRYISESGKWQLSSLQRDFQSFFQLGFEDPRLSHITQAGNYLLAGIRSGTHGRPVHPTLVTLLFVFGSEADALPLRTSRARSATVAPKEQSEIEAHRAAWLQFSHEHPEMTRTEMRMQASAQWSWLRRNDYKWLTEHQAPKTVGFRLHGPPKAKPAPKAVKQAVAAVTEDLRCSFRGRQPLPSVYQIRLAYGMRASAFERLAKEFGGVGADAQVPGSKHIFVARRAGHLESDSAPPDDGASEYAVSRHAGLMKSTLRKYLRRT